MKKHLYSLIIFLGITIFFSSCSSGLSIKKRRYNKGFHIELPSYSKVSQTASNNLSKKGIDVPLLKNDLYLKQDLPGTIPLLLDNIDLDNKPSKKEIKALIKELKQKAYTEEDCDEIITKSGDVISAKVLKVGVEEIAYKKCGRLDGPEYSISKSDVFMIKYKDGTTDVIKSSSNKTDKASSSQTDKDRKSGKGVGIFFVSLGFVVFLLLSMLAGGIIMLIGLLLVLLAK